MQNPAKMFTENPVRSRNTITAIPIILANAVAVTGQWEFVRQHLVTWGIPGQILFACALESIAIYLAYHAHLALLSNDSAMRLRLGSYAFGALIGILNYSHYANAWRPTFEAVAVGLMSAASPWLWGIHSRRVSRDELMSRGLVEAHAVRLGATRWTFHPFRSAEVFWRATWVGEQNLQRALALADTETEESGTRASAGNEARTWAREHGIPVNDRGPIPKTIREQYETATKVRAIPMSELRAIDVPAAVNGTRLS